MSRVSPSRPPANGKEPPMSDTYGPTLGTLFATYDPDTRSWKTSGGTCPSGLTEYSGTWPKMGWMRNGLSCQLPTPERRTLEKECSSWLPTPTASDFKRDGNAPASLRRKSPAVTVTRPYFTDDGVPRDDFREAVDYWAERTRPAPVGTYWHKPGDQRLTVEFLEWMMGLPDGHVSSVPGLSRSARIKLVGNGVCPQQAFAALELLMSIDEEIS